MGPNLTTRKLIYSENDEINPSLLVIALKQGISPKCSPSDY